MIPTRTIFQTWCRRPQIYFSKNNGFISANFQVGSSRPFSVLGLSRNRISNRLPFTTQRFQRRFCTHKTTPATKNTEGAPPPTTITFKEGAKTATRLSVFVGIGAAVIFFASLIIRELMPSRLSPNTVFNAVFDEIRTHHEVVSRVGENPKAYGRDFHQSKEGRRNFIDHDKFADLDGVQHIRVKFIIEGSKGKLNVFAETDATQSSKEFTYIIIEDARRPGSGIALVDNRREVGLEELQEKVAKKLTKLGAKLYGHTNCQWTQRQLIEFGDFSKELNSVMCDKDENKAECEKAGLDGYPSWVLNQEKLPGYQPLEQLRDIVQHM